MNNIHTAKSWGTDRARISYSVIFIRRIDSILKGLIVSVIIDETSLPIDLLQVRGIITSFLFMISSQNSYLNVKLYCTNT